MIGRYRTRRRRLHVRPTTPCCQGLSPSPECCASYGGSRHQCMRVLSVRITRPYNCTPLIFSQVYQGSASKMSLCERVMRVCIHFTNHWCERDLSTKQVGLTLQHSTVCSSQKTANTAIALIPLEEMGRRTWSLFFYDETPTLSFRCAPTNVPTLASPRDRYEQTLHLVRISDRAHRSTRSTPLRDKKTGGGNRNIQFGYSDSIPFAGGSTGSRW